MKISTHRPISRIFFVIALIIGLSNSISAQVDFVSNPASVSVNPNDTFSVVIRVEINSGDVDGAEIHLDFDATVLQVNSIDNLSSSQLPIPIRPITFDNINGAIDYVAGTFSPTPPVASFDFVQINFEAIAAGNTSMTYVYNSAVSPLRVSKITSNSFNVLDTANDVPVEVASANEDPVASFFASPTSGDAELLVTVDATASTDDGSIVSYDWDFGDTNTGTGVSATNNYLNQGVYTVTLTVTDNLGATDSSSQNITVNEVVIVDYTITASAGANGTIDPLSATVSEGENQTFTITPDTGYEIEDVFVDGGSVGAVPSYEFVNVQAAAAISATFSLIPVETIPAITLDAAATVSEGGTLNLPLSITDGDGDLLTVTVTSISNEPQNLQSNQGQNVKGIEPYPFDAGLFLSETSISNVAGSYASTLVFTPTFGDGGSNGDGNAVYTVTVQVNDEDGNSITQELELTVNDTNQFIAEAGITQLEAESYDNQGNTNGGDGIGVEVDGTGFIVGYTGNNDFIEYKLDVETAGLYQLDLFVGVPASAAGKTMEISVDGSLVGTYVAASTGGFGVFATQSININLDAGEQTLRYDFKSPQYIMNIDYFGLTYLSAVDLPPTIVALSDVEINEGGTVSVNVQVNDDITTDPAASIIIYDKSVPGGTNNPFTPAVAITGYTFTDNGGGSFTLNWPTMSIDGRSYEARVTGDDEVNSPVETRFTIDVAQNIAEIIPARTFSNPLPWYSSAPVSPFTVIIEDNTAQNLGYVDSGDFVEYLIDVPFAGTYDVEYMAGKGNPGPLSIQLSEENGAAYTALGSVDVNAGGWQTYLGYTHQATFSNTGVQTIRLDFSGAGGVNIKEFKFTLTSDSSPTINAIADVEANEGDVLSIPIIVVDDTNPSATIEIFDISAGGANAPFNPTAVVAVGSLTDNTGGNYTFDWTPASGEGRSYLARVTANDGSNPAVIEEFKINIAQQVPGTILARTFNNPLPFYGGGQSGSGGEDFSVAIETAGNIGYIEAGDYVEYLINVPAAGAYDVQFESANGSGANGSSTDISILEEGNAVPIGTITVPKAGWSNYQFFTTPITFANSGLQTLRLAFDGGVNTREFTFTPSTSNNAPVVTILTPDDGIGIVTGTNLSFTGTALDPEDSDLSSNISWSSDLQGALGTGPNISFVLTTLGTHIITAEVADNDPTTPLTGTATITVTVTETDPSCDARFRVNAGGSMLIASSGNFEEDRSTSTAGGTAQTGMPSAYVNTAPPAFDKTFGSNAPLVSNDTGYPDFLFQTERYSDAVDPDNMKWTFPTGNGVFEVKMLFNENWANENAQPQNNRIFDVIVEGELALDNYRPSGPIGADFNVAKVETYIATVEDGVLNIGFLKISENPSIKGFDICFVSDLMNADPVVAITTPTDGITVNRGEDVTLTGTATDAEDGDISDNLAWTSSDTQISTVPLNGIGAAITAQFVTPGDQTIRATVTDSDAAEVSDEITITVLGPQVAITDPTGVDPLCNTNVTLNWTGTNVLFGLTEHYHIYVNPPDINNIDTDTRISTASQIGQEFWDLTAIEGIIEGENVIVVRVANQSHDEFINTEAQDIITFTISSVSITSVDTTDVSECGVDNGSITINATGTNLEYSIDNGANFFATNSFTDLAAGDYDILVQETGSSSCFSTDTVTLVAPEAPSIASIDTIDVSECGVDNGSITINATGTNLEYSIDNGANFFATNSFTDLAAGTYDIVVQEFGTNSCAVMESITLAEPMAPMPIISGPLTYIEGSGGVTLDAGPDWASYLWSPGGETTQTINATAGTYTVAVVNADGCEGTSVGVIVTEDDDDIAPNAICQNIVLQLDGAGNASITAEQIDDGSNDESGIASLAISMETFTCANLGANSVMLTVTDTNGNVSNCSATVTVEDKVDPMITCPAGITMSTSAPQVLMVESATAIDNCDSAIIPTFVRSDNAALGLNDPFPIGQTLIQWTATDASGNVDVCTQTITLTLAQSMANDIIAFEVPGQVGNEVVDANTKTVEIIVQLGTDVAALVPTIQISSLASITPDSGIVQNFGSPVVYTVAAEDGTTQQWTVTVTIEADTTAPFLVSLNPLDNSTDINEDAILMATFDEPVQLSTGGEITITDLTDNTAFGIVGLNGPITFVGNTLSIDPMALFEAGHEYSVEISNTALEDLSGNPFAGIPINGWTFTIFDDITPPEIICPDDIVVDNDPGECGAVVNYNIPIVNGGNSLLARAIPVVEGEPVRTEGLPTGAFFPIGTTTVTYEVTDENGNTASCSFEVIVNDTELPTISCTTDMNRVAALGDTSLVVNFTTPDFDDNCPSATIVQTAGLASGVAFPIGVTTNTFEVTDASGNKETCSFDITIEAEVPTTLSVTSFTLVDADTDQDLFTLVEGMQIDMNSLPTLHLDIRANTTSDVESVRFNLSGELTRSHGESLPPYALFRDLPIGDYMGADFVEGGYSLTGTPYSEDSLRGDQGTPLTVSFSLVDGDPVCESLTAEVVVVNPLTCDGIGSRITIIPSGGTAPFEVSWQNFSSEDESIDDLTAGTYTIDVTDSNGCSIRVEAVIVNPELPEVTLEPFTNMLVSDAAIILDQGFPMGGSYSGVGVSGGDTFNPMTAGAGTHEITYTYTDPVTLCANMSTGQITVTNPSAFALRINTGGVETTYNTNIFMTDAYFNTGNVLDRPQTGLPEPFQTFRFSTSQQMSYDIPLPDGEYIVNLYFAELWFGASGGGLPGAGRRVFDVSIEGQLEEDNLDIFAEVGAETMLIKSHTVTVTGGVLDIDFNATDAVGGERHPVINAIEILGSGGIVPENPIANAGPDREIELPTNELTLDGSGSDPDGGSVTFEWFVISGPNSPGVANINTKDVSVSNMIEGTYVFRLDVTDDENVTVSDLVTVTVLPEPVVGDFAMRINAGGTEIVYDNNVFITDTYFDVGRTLDRPQTGLPDPFKTFRYSPSQQLGYDIPVPDGEYTVNLYFAELWFGASGGGLPGAGRRVFDVSIEGQLEEDNLDIFAEVGAETMLIKSHTVTVTGGVLNIDLNSTDAVGGVRHPVINAIEIMENGVSMPTLALRNANTNKSVLSPNPVISITSLSFEKPVQLSDIQVFDVAGRLIRTFNSAEVFAKGVYNLDVYDLESGIYFINALDTQGVLHQKQMVIKK